MKTTALMLAATVLTTALWADGEPAALATEAHADTAELGVDFDSVTARTLITLSTNADFKVVCQIAYCDFINPVPSTPEKIREAENMDRFLNLGLQFFLAEHCADMSRDALVAAYRYGYLRTLVADEFAFWIGDRCNELNEKYGKMMIDVAVHSVTMRAVGPFAKAVAE